MEAACVTDPTWQPDVAEPGLFETLFRGLDACSAPLTGPVKPRLLVLPLHDADRRPVGGLWAMTHWRWLHVQMLFVPEALRGRGIGTELMARAEVEARLRLCLGAYVDTFSFQAEPFYRRLGYERFGELAQFPPGHSRIFLRKSLAADPVASAVAA